MPRYYWDSKQIFAGSTRPQPVPNPRINSAICSTSQFTDDTLVRSCIEGTVRIAVTGDTTNMPTDRWWLNLTGRMGLWHDGGLGSTPRTPPFSPVTDPNPQPAWLISTPLDATPYNMGEDLDQTFSYGIIMRIPGGSVTSKAQRTNEHPELQELQHVWACFSVSSYLFPDPGHNGPPDYNLGIDMYVRTLWASNHP